MKTRVFKISRMIFTLSICFALQACNKSDFYQKDYLDNPYQNDPETDGSVNGGNNGGTAGGSTGSSTDGGNNGGTNGNANGNANGGANGNANGGVNGNANGGTNGSSTAGTDGGTAGGSTTGSSTAGTTGGTDGSSTGGSNTTTGGSSTGGSTTGSTVGGTTGGVDGSTTSGGTTGSSTGSSTGGSTTGSSTGGSTTGSSTGGSTTGSSTGGSTTGSSTGGSTTGSSTGGSTGGVGDCNNGHGNDPDHIDESNPTIGLEAKCRKEMEKFSQSNTQTKKLDIVWIVDNSGSMADEQNALGVNFSSFIDNFITKDVDFKMAITTTDASSSYLKGRMVSGSDTKLTSARAQSNEAQFKDDFRNLVRVGTSGSGYEKGLEASEGFMQKYGKTFLREDAYLAVVLISDEEDQSSKAVKDYADYLKSFKKEAGLVKFYTIADINRTNSGYGITTGADRYIEASNETAGSVNDIRADFGQSLADMGDSIINLLDSFALAYDPLPGTLSVYINGDKTTNFTFDAASRSIKFDAGHLPPVGAKITVLYSR